MILLTGVEHSNQSFRHRTPVLLNRTKIDFKGLMEVLYKRHAFKREILQKSDKENLENFEIYWDKLYGFRGNNCVALQEALSFYTTWLSFCGEPKLKCKILLRLSEIYRKLGVSTSELAEEAVELYPKDSRGYLEWGKCLIAQGDLLSAFGAVLASLLCSDEEEGPSETDMLLEMARGGLLLENPVVRLISLLILQTYSSKSRYQLLVESSNSLVIGGSTESLQRTGSVLALLWKFLIDRKEEDESLGPVLNCMLKVVMRNSRVLIDCCSIQEILYTNYTSIKENFQTDKEYDAYLGTLANSNHAECASIKSKFVAILGRRSYLEELVEVAKQSRDLLMEGGRLIVRKQYEEQQKKTLSMQLLAKRRLEHQLSMLSTKESAFESSAWILPDPDVLMSNEFRLCLNNLCHGIIVPRVVLDELDYRKNTCEREQVQSTLRLIEKRLKDYPERISLLKASTRVKTFEWPLQLEMSIEEKINEGGEQDFMVLTVNRRLAASLSIKGCSVISLEEFQQLHRNQ